MKTFKRLLAFVKPLHHYLPEYVIYSLIGIIFGLINFAMLAPLLNVLFIETPPEPPGMPEFSLTIGYFTDLFQYHFLQISDAYGKMYALGFVCIIIASATVIANGARYLSMRVMIRLRMNVLERIRNNLYERVTSQSLSFFNKRRKGDLLSVMTNDVSEVEYIIANSIQVLLRDPFVIIFTFFLLFYISVQLTLFTLVFFPLSGLLISYISKQLRKKGYYSQEMLGKMLNVSEETLGGVRIVQSFTAETYMQRKFGVITSAFTRLSKAIYNQRELASPISEALGVTLVVVLVMVGGYMVLGKQIEPGTFIMYLGLYFTILQPAKNISNAFTSMQRGLVAGERIFDVLDEPVEIEDKPDAVPVSTFQDNISYQHLSFKYEDQYVLRDINLTIEKGKMIALVGKSGAGKSTMADLLPRFYDASEGKITIDGKDIRDLKLHDLRQLMGIVSQEAILFNDSVLNNIAFGQADADPAKVIEAARIANAHEFITQLDNGYDTLIGDRGSKLSGGQRQRLTIARAIFKNPPILILDEATSALDTESEKLVQEALDKLMQNRTTIVIAHRLSTIQHAHEIIVMDKGEIMERGQHDQLLANNGIYRKLVEMQEFK
ncbi:ATP-binding cassette domain-containing protein [Chitinophaga sp. SYP-B3965]|uniref:ABC transporter ATP-binding protein n=1 Tax=Chitinophaga sp. SYP-B3965 TaxID=2663120 RepID=UPI001299E50E|nr:ABC transporter ATP-binding protein [Chitinophaga sp. SYP-B3965]MRG49088.1 ATP-binding cassette domain-containing protein [Chitinophaga sp. SYP-B3965]